MMGRPRTENSSDYIHSVIKVQDTYTKQLTHMQVNPDKFFFPDVPHLIKTVRNAWSNSFAHKNSRALWVSLPMLLFNLHYDIVYIIFCVDQWTTYQLVHLTSLYNKCASSSGLSLCPKIKLEHIRLNSYSRMRVPRYDCFLQYVYKSFRKPCHD